MAFMAISCHAGVFDETSYLYGPSSVKPGIYMARAKGHSRDPELIGTNDVLGGMFASGWFGTAYSSTPRVSMQMMATETWSSTANGSKVFFQTTPATTVVPVTGLTISGNVVRIDVDGLVLPINAAPRTNVTPTIAGQIIYNSADKELCFSTGTTVTSWVLSSNPATACSH